MGPGHQEKVHTCDPLARLCSSDVRRLAAAMPNPLETAGNLVHDKIITKVNPKAISVGIVGAPAIRNVFTSLKERLIDEEYMPGSLSRAIGVTL